MDHSTLPTGPIPNTTISLLQIYEHAIGLFNGGRNWTKGSWAEADSGYSADVHSAYATKFCLEGCLLRSCIDLGVIKPTFTDPRSYRNHPIVRQVYEPVTAMIRYRAAHYLPDHVVAILDIPSFNDLRETTYAMIDGIMDAAVRYAIDRPQTFVKVHPPAEGTLPEAPPEGGEHYIAPLSAYWNMVAGFGSAPTLLGVGGGGGAAGGKAYEYA